MLKEARQLGIVEIKILEPWDRNVELEQEFMRRFALKDVRVISVKEANNTMVLQKLGEVAAYYLDNLLNDNMILGISWGIQCIILSKRSRQVRISRSQSYRSWEQPM